MSRRLVLIAVFGIFLVGCATMPNGQTSPQEVIVKIQVTDPTKVIVAQKDEPDRINRSMEVPNQEGHLSQLSFISKDRAFIKIFSGLSVSDVTRLWNDLVVLENNTKIRCTKKTFGN